jgi:hypothetical protein
MSTSVITNIIHHRLDRSLTLDCEEQFGHLQLVLEPSGLVFRLADDDAWALADAIYNWLETRPSVSDLTGPC